MYAIVLELVKRRTQYECWLTLSFNSVTNQGKIWNEFNTLAVVYGMPSSRFPKPINVESNGEANESDYEDSEVKPDTSVTVIK